MAALGASDVTFTIKNLRRNGNSRVANRVGLAFGDGAKTYSAGGIPITIGNLGCPNVVESLSIVVDGSTGYKYSYDQANKKLMIFQAPAQTHVHDIKALGGLTSSEPLLLDASQNFGKNAATNRTIVGSTSATTGGIVSATLAAASLVEVTSVALAAQSIEVEVIGW